jgi:hypothetical protein
MTGNLEMAKPVPLLGRGGAGLRGKYKSKVLAAEKPVEGGNAL